MIQYLEWESKHFNKEIYSLVDHEITNDQLRECLEAKYIDLIQCKCDVSKTNFINLLCSNKFELASISITLSKALSKEIKQISNMDESIFVANETDIVDIKEIAKKSFRYSRFFHPFFDEIKVHDIYSQWAEKSVIGKFDNICFIAKEKNIISGFMTLRFVTKSICKIGLIAVNKKYRGMKVGKRLLNYASIYASHHGYTTLQVETQYENKEAISLYQKQAFSVDLVEAWMYLFPYRSKYLYT